MALVIGQISRRAVAERVFKGVLQEPHTEAAPMEAPYKETTTIMSMEPLALSSSITTWVGVAAVRTVAAVSLVQVSQSVAVSAPEEAVL